MSLHSLRLPLFAVRLFGVKHFIPEPQEPSETIVSNDPALCEKDIFARKERAAQRTPQRSGEMVHEWWPGLADHVAGPRLSPGFAPQRFSSSRKLPLGHPCVVHHWWILHVPPMAGDGASASPAPGLVSFTVPLCSGDGVEVLPLQAESLVVPGKTWAPVCVGKLQCGDPSTGTLRNASIPDERLGTARWWSARFRGFPGYTLTAEGECEMKGESFFVAIGVVGEEPQAYPLSTNLLTTNVAGTGTMLFFRFQFALPLGHGSHGSPVPQDTLLGYQRWKCLSSVVELE
eukprot:Skav232645  [mRNA]  locus=scaffold2334:42208:50306:- [translate_table: standard]